MYKYKLMKFVLRSVVSMIGLVPLVASASVDSGMTPRAIIPGSVRRVSLHQQQTASCEVIRRRLLMDVVREGEANQVISSLKKGAVLSRSQLADLKIMAARNRSRVPGEKEHNEMIFASWKVPADLDSGVRASLKAAILNGAKHVRIGLVDWISVDGFLPADVDLRYVDGVAGDADEVELRFASNSIDACFGPSDVEIAMPVAGRVIDFTILGPAYNK